jgi:GTP-binding protein HflX
VLLTDTVGFIQKLPTGLIAAFRATLEEVVEADLLLHVIDASHPQALEQARAVYATLKEIKAGDIPMINVLNKIDRFADPEAACASLCQLDDSVAVSALTGMGLDVLLSHIEEVLEAEMVRVDVVIPFDRGDLVGLFHERGLIDKEEYREAGTHIVGRLPETLALQFNAFRTPRRTKQTVLTATDAIQD